MSCACHFTAWFVFFFLRIYDRFPSHFIQSTYEPRSKPRGCVFFVVVLLLGQCFQAYFLEMHDLPALGHLPWYSYSNLQKLKIGVIPLNKWCGWKRSCTTKIGWLKPKNKDVGCWPPFSTGAIFRNLHPTVSSDEFSVCFRGQLWCNQRIWVSNICWLHVMAVTPPPSPAAFSSPRAWPFRGRVGSLSLVGADLSHGKYHRSDHLYILKGNSKPLA